MKNRTLRNKRGFTLIEVLIVIAVIALLMGIAAPNLGSKMRDYRLSAGIRDLQSAVQSARIGAIKRSEKVCMAFNFAGDQCTIFVDDGINEMSLDGGELVLNSLSMPSGIDFYDTESGVAAIQFNSRGMLQSSDRLQIRSTDGQYRGVAVSITGNSRIVKSADGGSWQ